MRSPLFTAGLFFVIAGILILLFPHLLQIIIAVFLIFIGGSLLSLDQLRRSGKPMVWFNWRGPRR